MRSLSRIGDNVWPVVLAMVGAAAFVSLAAHQEAGLLAVSGFLASIPFLLPLTGRKFHLFEPINIYAAGFALLFVARPWYEYTHDLSRLGLLGYDYRPTLAKAQIVGIVGTLAVYAGYYIGGGRTFAASLPILRDNYDRRALRRIIGILFAASLTIFAIYTARSGGLGYLRQLVSGRTQTLSATLQGSSGYLYSAPYWLEAAGFLLLARQPRWLSIKAVPGFLLVLCSVSTNLGSGDRSILLPAALGLVMVRYLRKGRQPSLRFLSVALIVVFVLGVSLPRQIRTVNAAGQRPTVGEALHESVKFGDMFDELLGGADTAMIGSLATELHVVPAQIPYQYGKTYVQDVTRPIPRAFWPSKPRASDTILNEALYPDTARAKVGFAFSIFGEPWHNGGFPGVIIVMGLFGLLMRTQWEWFQRSPLNATAITLYALTIPYVFVFMRGGIGVDYQREIIAVAPLFLLYRYGFGSRVEERDRRRREDRQEQFRRRAGIPVHSA